MKLKTVCLKLITNSFAKKRDNNLEQSGYKSIHAENMTLETVCCCWEAKKKRMILIIQPKIDRVAIFAKEIGDNSIFFFPFSLQIAS